jgi:ribosomal protein S6--L-glutamate ligase
VGYDKVEMTRAFTAVAPEHCPRTLILPASPAGAEEAMEELGFPFVVKHPRSSMGRGVELVESRADLHAWIGTAEVLYAQEYLPSNQDLRVVWVGDQVVTANWRRGGDGFRHNFARGGELAFEDIPHPALELVTRVATVLGIDHAGFDLAVIDGWPYLIELNCLFGHAGIKARGIRLAPLILGYLERILRPGSEPAPPANQAA